MKRTLLLLAAATLAADTAHAHLTYTGRDFGIFSGAIGQTATISNQAINGNHGFADATDDDYGDSHKARAFRFTLEAESDVQITFSANPTATPASNPGLLPGLTLYSGLVHTPPAAADHDFSPASAAYLATLPGPAKEGAWNARGDLVIGNDDGDLSHLTFIGYAVDGTAANFGAAPGLVGDGLADGIVSAIFHLGAGSYTLLVGGADYLSQDTPSNVLPFGVAGTVTTVPEVGTGALVAAGLVALRAAGRRRRGGPATIYRRGPARD